MFLQMFLGETEDVVAVLVRHQTERELRHRVTRNDGLGSHPLVTAADTVELGGRTSPNSFERRVGLFAKERRSAGLVEDRFVAIDRQFAPSFALPVFEGLHLVVE